MHKGAFLLGAGVAMVGIGLYIRNQAAAPLSDASGIQGFVDGAEKLASLRGTVDGQGVMLVQIGASVAVAGYLFGVR